MVLSVLDRFALARHFTSVFQRREESLSAPNVPVLRLPRKSSATFFLPDGKSCLRLRVGGLELPKAHGRTGIFVWAMAY